MADIPCFGVPMTEAALLLHKLAEKEFLVFPRDGALGRWVARNIRQQTGEWVDEKTFDRRRYPEGRAPITAVSDLLLEIAKELKGMEIKVKV